ncbi:MAG: PEGA domain-containing protein [Pseudomonadota bacterium]
MTRRKIAALVSAAAFLFLFSFETMAKDKKAAAPSKKEAKADKGKGKKDDGKKKDAKKKDKAVKKDKKEESTAAEEGADKKETGEEKDKKTKKGNVKKIHAEAVKFYKEGNFAQAVERFKEANEIVPNPVTLFNIARCYEKLDRLDLAYEYYAKYVETGDKTRLLDADEAIEKIEKTKVLLKVKTKPGGALVFLDGDGEALGKTPLAEEISAGGHTLHIRKDGYEEVEETVDVAFGGDASLDLELDEIEGGGEIEGEGAELRLEGEAKKSLVPISLGLGVGATVSTTDLVGSYIDASLYVTYRIKQFAVGIGIDNLFFGNSYLMAVFPVGTYTLKVWKDLSLNFAVGFGAAYLHAFDDYRQVSSGAHWDLVVHVDAKLLYKLGPVYIIGIPLCTEILVGAGSVDPAPLAQFAFLAGVGYDF